MEVVPTSGTSLFHYRIHTGSHHTYEPLNICNLVVIMKNVVFAPITTGPTKFQNQQACI
jgi:hypothetical protein